jgi:hypothetical protein
MTILLLNFDVPKMIENSDLSPKNEPDLKEVDGLLLTIFREYMVKK